MENKETSRGKPSSRDRLLETARQLFYDQGYNATTLAQISDKSGVNNGLITYYFGTKNNLAQEIYNLFLMNIRSEISMRLFEKKKEFNMALNIAVENRMLLTQKFENPNLLRFYNEYQRGSDAFGKSNPRRERYYELQKEFINPDISDDDLKLYSVCGISMIRSMVDAYEKGYLKMDLEYIKDYAVRFLFTMLHLQEPQILSLIEESRYWESQLNIHVGPNFEIVSL